MTQFSAMIQALATAVQTLADGGGPFWEADTEKQQRDDDSDRADADAKHAPVGED